MGSYNRFNQFDNISSDYIPDNRKDYLTEDEFDQITIGATNKHMFVLNFILSERCSDIDVIYRQSLDTILIKQKTQLDIVERANGRTYITCVLSPKDSNKFVSFRECRAQLKLTMLNGEIAYGEENPIKVLDTTESDIIVSNTDSFYNNLVKVSDFLYSYRVSDLDYNFAKDWFKKSNKPLSTNACSTISKGNLLGRNADGLYNNQVEFIIKTSPKVVNGQKERHQSISVASYSPITKDFIDSLIYDEETLGILPFMISDGINDSGVCIASNTVSFDDKRDYTRPTVPLEEMRERLCASLINRYVLDNFSSATDAVNYLRKYVSIYLPNDLYGKEIDIHWMIKDSTNTFILEMIEEANGINRLNIAQHNILTNFYLNNVVTSGGFVSTPESYIGDNHITNFGKGLERYNLIASNYNTLETKQNMRDLLTKLYISHSYQSAANKQLPFWYSEYTGNEISYYVWEGADGLTSIQQKTLTVDFRANGQTFNTIIYNSTPTNDTTVTYKNGSTEIIVYQNGAWVKVEGEEVSSWKTIALLNGIPSSEYEGWFLTNGKLILNKQYLTINTKPWLYNIYSEAHEQSIINYYNNLYLNQNRNDENTIITTHSSIYDINAKKLYITSQEEINEFEFSI